MRWLARSSHFSGRSIARWDGSTGASSRKTWPSATLPRRDKGSHPWQVRLMMPTCMNTSCMPRSLRFPGKNRSLRTALAKEAFGGLTEREREVVRLVAQGKSNREIADALVVTETNHRDTYQQYPVQAQPCIARTDRRVGCRKRSGDTLTWLIGLSTEARCFAASPVLCTSFCSDFHRQMYAWHTSPPNFVVAASTSIASMPEHFWSYIKSTAELTSASEPVPLTA